MRPVGELLVFAVLTFLPKALTARKPRQTDGGEDMDIRSEHCQERHQVFLDTVPVFFACGFDANQSVSQSASSLANGNDGQRQQGKRREPL